MITLADLVLNLEVDTNINVFFKGKILHHRFACLYDKVKTIRDFYKSKYMDIADKINFFEDKFDGEPLAIMPLEEFKKFYQEQFES